MSLDDQDPRTLPATDATGWLRVERQAGSSQRHNPRFELFVLGELMNGPLHGYHLREILNRVLGPFRQMSWGALYPLLHALEREGLIAADSRQSTEARQERNGNRQRHAYHITEAGRERFLVLMREPAAYSVDSPEIFMVKLNLFAYISADVQLNILQHHRAYLQIAVDYLLKEQHFVIHRTTLPEHERPHILRLLSYRLSGTQAELAWIDDEIGRLG